MAISLGFDLADVSLVRESLAAHGERYLTRIYSSGERAACGDDPRKLASRFAAKEATMKALRRADEPLPWTEIEVVDRHGGPAGIVLHGRALELARRRGLAPDERMRAPARARRADGAVRRDAHAPAGAA